MLAVLCALASSHFVIATSAVVRRAPDDSAPVVIDAAIGTAVEVTMRERAWARIVVGPRTFRYDAVDGEPIALAPRAFDARMLTGWVHAADLAPTAPSLGALLDEAKSATNDATRRTLLLRAWALDPFDPAVAKVVAPSARGLTSRRQRTTIDRADLVYGCNGDLTRASVIGGSLASLGAARFPSTAPNVCVAGLDIRPPCDPKAATAHKAELARLVPRFGRDGPALRLVAGPGTGERPLWVVTRLLAVDGCVDCAPTAATTDVRVVRLRVPRVDKGLTMLHVLVPRALGVLYDIVTADTRDDVEDEPQSFDLGDAFDADPREHVAGDHLFAAPDACSCTCNDRAEDEP